MEEWNWILLSNRRSKILEIEFRSEIGLKFLGFKTSLPGLGIIMITARFHSWGKYSALEQELKIWQMWDIIFLSQYLRALLLMPSGPGALRVGRDFMVFQTSPGVKYMGWLRGQDFKEINSSFTKLSVLLVEGFGFATLEA
jgi:hypothetical protein